MSTAIYKMELIGTSTEILDELDFLILASGSDSRAYEVLSKCTSILKNQTIFFHFAERINGLPADDPLFNFKKYSYNKVQEIYCEIKNPSSSLEELERNTFSNATKIGTQQLFSSDSTTVGRFHTR